MITYGDALKAFRRGCYKYPQLWQAMVVCHNANQMRYAFDEAHRVLEASSLNVEAVSYSKLTIETERGGVLRFHVFMDKTDEYKLGGMAIPQFIVVFDAPMQLMGAIKCRNRSAFVDSDDLRIDRATL